MESLIASLMQARTTAHYLHLNTRSFARHLALGELYDQLSSHIDALAELVIGQTGSTLEKADTRGVLHDADPIEFVNDLADMLASLKPQLNMIGFIQNKYEELEADVIRAKYKLERLQ